MRQPGILSGTKAELDVSVVLCTRNRARQLARTLARLEELRTELRWELVLVDNGSTDDTAAVMAAAVSRGLLPLVTLTEPQAGVSRAKNRGLRVARGAVIAFTDDDCYPTPDFVDAWYGVLTEGDLEFAGGRITLFDPTDAPMTTKPEATPQTFAPRAFIPAGCIHGANMAFRRSVISHIGGFDEDFGPGALYRAADDCEYFQRASNAGFVGGFRPEPLVAHHHGRKQGAIGNIVFDYEFGRGAFYAETLISNPTCMIRYFREWSATFPGPIALIKAIYWAQRRDLPRRMWNVGWGMIRYAWERAI